MDSSKGKTSPTYNTNTQTYIYECNGRVVLTAQKFLVIDSVMMGWSLAILLYFLIYLFILFFYLFFFFVNEWHHIIVTYYIYEKQTLSYSFILILFCSQNDFYNVHMQLRRLNLAFTIHRLPRKHIPFADCQENILS